MNAQIIKTLTVTLKTENEGDLCAVAESRDAERETISIVFDGVAATATFADDSDGSIESMIGDLLDADDNVVSYKFA